MNAPREPMANLFETVAEVQERKLIRAKIADALLSRAASGPRMFKYNEPAEQQAEDEPLEDDDPFDGDYDDEPAHVLINGQTFMRDGAGCYTNIEDPSDLRIFEMVDGALEQWPDR